MKLNLFKKRDNNKPRKWKSKFAKVGVCLLAFIGGLAATYFLVPNRILTIDLGMPDSPEAGPETYFNKFVSKISPLISGGEVDETFGLHAEFDEFSVSWPLNELKIKGELNASIVSLKDMDLTLDVDVNYNGKDIDLGIGYVDKTVYLATKDLKLKTCFVNDREANNQFVTMFKHLGSLFFDPENEDGLQIDLQIGEVLGSLIGGLDLSSLGGAGLDISETEDETYAYSNLKIAIDEETTIALQLVLNKETISLEKVDLGTMKFGDVTIAGRLKCHTDSKLKVYALDDPEYKYKQRGAFVETFHYSSWIDSIFNLLKTRTIGLDLQASLRDKDKSYGVVDATIDLDASRFKPLDIIGTVIGPELFGLAPVETEPVSKSYLRSQTVEGEDGSINSILETINNFDFNVGLKLANTKVIDEVPTLVDYSNLNIAYFKDSDDTNTGYISLNDDGENAVMKAKVNVSTINYLINAIPELIEDLSEEKPSKLMTRSEFENEPETGLFDFLTSSELIKAIEKGHYEGILDVLEEVKSTEKDIQITLNLSYLGFGEDAKVKLVLDASNEEPETSKVLNLSLQNVEFGKMILDANINTREFNKTSITKIDETRSTYDDLNFVPGTFEQVSQIMNTKQAGVTLDGSVLDEENLGVTFEGWAQLDYGDLNGFGHLTINEYKYAADRHQTPHEIDLSIDNFGNDHSKNEMLFEYRNKLRGKVTLKTFDDIIDVVMKLVKEPDTRFTKFIAPILEKIMGSVIVQAITNEDYLSLTQSSLLKSIKQIDQGKSVEIVLSKELLMDFIPNDLILQLNFKTDAKKQKCIDSIEVKNLGISGKTINAKISLADYVAEKQNPVEISENFLDFSDISVLLEFGINTTELTYYHLTADAKLGLNFFSIPGLDLNLVRVNLDFHIYVNGEITKVYGIMKDNPIPLKYGFSEFVFEPSHDETDKIGGIFYIYRRENHLLRDDKEFLYAADSSNFLENILIYLLSGFMGLSSSTASGLGNLDLTSKDEVDPHYEDIFTSTGFVYSADEAKNKYTWKTGISIEALTAKTTIDPIEATITGTKTGGMGYLTQIDATTKIASAIPITAVIKLDSPNPDVLDWPVDVQNRYAEIIAMYNGLSSDDKANAYNNPTVGYSHKI